MGESLLFRSSNRVSLVPANPYVCMYVCVHVCVHVRVCVCNRPFDDYPAKSCGVCITVTARFCKMLV
jgi:hypothetical protein